MMNVYVDKEVKDCELIKKILNSFSLEINAFSNVSEVASNQVHVAIIWLVTPSCLKDFVNLKLLLTSGSGIDHIIDSNLLPHSVSTIRLVDQKLRNKVADYVVEEVNNYKKIINEPDNTKITVGIMGLGLIGQKSVEKLSQLGYKVVGWAQSKDKKRAIRSVFIGGEHLNSFANKCNVIVCHLPLTQNTIQILNKNLFDSMPKNGYIINVGRGAHLNEEDLIATIQKKHLIGACLDVFKIEPLPLNDKLNDYTQIKLTPHIAGGIFPEEQAKYAIDVIKNFFKGDTEIEGLINFNKKY
jgi:glyoxylate/hydroxypyruvate reductase A